MIVPKEVDIVLQGVSSDEFKKDDVDEWRNNPGNVRFRYWVLEKKDAYDDAPNQLAIIKEIAQQVEASGGRFVLNTAKLKDGIYRFVEQIGEDAEKIIRDAFDDVRPLDILGDSEERYRQPGVKIFHQLIQERYNDYVHATIKKDTFIEVASTLQDAGSIFFKKGSNNNWKPMEAKDIMDKVGRTFRQYKDKLRKKVDQEKKHYRRASQKEKEDIIEDIMDYAFDCPDYNNFRNLVRKLCDEAAEEPMSVASMSTDTLSEALRAVMEVENDALKTTKKLPFALNPDLCLAKNLAINPQDGLQGALAMAQSSSRWLLINLQKGSEFPSHDLKWDVWEDKTVQSIIQENFVFWQKLNIDAEARVYAALNRVHHYPHVAILHPFTAQVHWRNDTDQSIVNHQMTAKWFIEFCQIFLGE